MEGHGIIWPPDSPSVYEHLNRMRESKWLPNQVVYGQVHAQAADLNAWQHEMLLAVHVFFARIDGAICECINGATQGHQSGPYADFAYAEQAAQEARHAETYQRIFEALVPDRGARETLLRDALPSVTAKSAWLRAQAAQVLPERRITALLALEGVAFVASFTVIFYLNNLQLAREVGSANRWIRDDEMTHAELHARVLAGLPRCDAGPVLDEVVALEVAFFEEIVERLTPAARAALPADLQPAVMAAHVRYTANQWLQRLGQPLRYAETASPYAWWEFQMNVAPTQNSFETTPTNYQDASALRTSDRHAWLAPSGAAAGF